MKKSKKLDTKHIMKHNSLSTCLDSVALYLFVLFTCNVPRGEIIQLYGDRGRGGRGEGGNGYLAYFLY